MVQDGMTDQDWVVGNPTPPAAWRTIYPNVEPARRLKLPSCARHWSVFVYDLPPMFHAELLESMEKQRGKANCDWARSPCIERHREPAYSSLRQFAAEVPLLAKLLSLPQASHAEDADLIVVPWFASTELSAEQRPWYPKNPLAVARFKDMQARLKHFHSDLRARHLFLSSRDWTFTVIPLREMIAETGALLATYGPSRPGRPNEILVAPNDAGFGYPLHKLRHPPRHFLFAMFDERINKIRQDFARALRKLQKLRWDLSVKLYPITDHMSLALGPAQTHALMSDTLLCPILQGDLPYQHRLFDALACGCVPLLLRYRYPTPANKACETWSWDSRNRSVQKGATRVTIPTDICLANTLPYHESVDWASITVRIDARAMADNRLAGAIAGLDRRVIAQKRRRIETIRHLFIYDWSGSTFDAFSATMRELCRVLPARNASKTHMRS